jgi:AcrR family transcriptional regulator
VKSSPAGPRDNRSAILEAAARTIAQRGVRGLRVEDVAAEAGVSAPLLYYHFESRSGLIKAALEAASEQAPSTALRGKPAEGRTGFEALQRALLAELAEDPTIRHNAVVWGEVSASAVFEPDLRDDVRRVTETWRAEVAAGIRAGIADSSIDPDVEADDAADLLITLVDGLLARWLAGTMELDRARELLTGELRARLLR